MLVALLTFLTLFFVMDSTANTWSPIDDSSIATRRSAQDSNLDPRCSRRGAAVDGVKGAGTAPPRAANTCSERRTAQELRPSARLVHFLNVRHINTGQRAALSRARPLSIA